MTEGGLESLFLRRVLDHLAVLLPESSAKRLQFVLYKHRPGVNAPVPRFAVSGRNAVLILMCDERSEVQISALPEFRAVFRSYLRDGVHPANVFSFPLGYSTAVGEMTPIPFNERSTNVFFSGNLNSRRVDIYRHLKGIPLLPKHNLRNLFFCRVAAKIIRALDRSKDFSHLFPSSYLRFTNGFMQGMSGKDYASKMADSKIAICPPGFASSELIRFGEAMRLGCVIIADQLPSNELYKSSPIIQLSAWSNLTQTIKDLLINPGDLFKRHQETDRWWEDVLGEQATALRMAGVIMDQENESNLTSRNIIL